MDKRIVTGILAVALGVGAMTVGVPYFEQTAGPAPAAEPDWWNSRDIAGYEWPELVELPLPSADAPTAVSAASSRPGTPFPARHASPALAPAEASALHPTEQAGLEEGRVRRILGQMAFAISRDGVHEPLAPATLETRYAGHTPAELAAARDELAQRLDREVSEAFAALFAAGRYELWPADESFELAALNLPEARTYPVVQLRSHPVTREVACLLWLPFAENRALYELRDELVWLDQRATASGFPAR